MQRQRALPKAVSNDLVDGVVPANVLPGYKERPLGVEQCGSMQATGGREEPLGLHEAAGKAIEVSAGETKV